jgi:uncharacterized protein (DUF1501 family)
MTNRRHFLGTVGVLSTVGLASSLDVLHFFADAKAQSTTDYRALVCVFMFGGNDGNNTVIPIDNIGYGSYAVARPGASGINLAQSSLLPIQPANLGTPFGLHPSLGELQSLFNKGKMAILANVGTLRQPTTQAQYNAGIRPDSLYLHADQQEQWQSAIYTGSSNTGWGGRLADKVASYNAATSFPVITSFDGRTLFTAGMTDAPICIHTSGSFAPSDYASSGVPMLDRVAVRTQLRVRPAASAFVTTGKPLSATELRILRVVNPIIDNAKSKTAPFFASLTSDISSQLFQVAKMIEGRAATGAKRQIFFAQLGSFDTHNDQLNRQQKLFSDLSPALSAFYNATVALGVSPQVTTFTMSEFGRTFRPTAGGGTDHGWGNHHFIIGDAVNGGSFYGQYPTLLIGGPNDAAQQGLWIPTTAVDQYGATLAKWFGVVPEDINTVFPSVAKFGSSDLGFLT